MLGRRTKAAQFFRQACDRGDAEACYYTWEYSQPPDARLEGGTSTLWENNHLLKRAAHESYKQCFSAAADERAQAHTCYQAGRWLVMSNDLDKGTAAYTRAVVGLRRACAAPAADADACLVLAQAEATVPARHAAAARACDLGASAACLLEANRARDALDFARARQLYQRGCDATADGGHPAACYNLGALLARGLGAPVDLAAADIAFQKACARGDDRSCALSASYAVTKEFGALLRPLRLATDPKRL